jgi:hypothetical protein
MALQLTIDFKGVQVPDAYHCISRIEGKTTMGCYVTCAAARGGEPLCETRYEFVYSIGGPNAIQQAYEHLKTLPDFEDAMDVLEAGQIE